MTKDEALKLAFDALNDMACWQEGREVDMGFDEPYAADTSRKAITAIKEALAQPKEPDPVAWMIWCENNVPSLTFKKPSDKYVFDSLYTTPPQRKPLTNEEADGVALDVMGFAVLEKEQAKTALMLIRATEAAHGIKGD